MKSIGASTYNMPRNGSHFNIAGTRGSRSRRAASRKFEIIVRSKDGDESQDLNRMAMTFTRASDVRTLMSREHPHSVLPPSLISTRATRLTPLHARARLPSRVTDTLRTTPPPEGIAQ